MRTTPTRKHMIAAAVAGATASALLLVGAGTAQAVQNVSEHGAVTIIADLPMPRDCAGCAGVDPLPEPPHFPNDKAGIGNPNDRVSLGGPDTSVGIGNPNDRVSLGGPDTSPGIGNPNDASKAGAK